jgi:fructoselysine-6-P-deglycase FrlB-like protein
MNLTYTEILDTFNALKKTTGYLEGAWNDIENLLAGKKRFVFIGCGSSYLVAKSMAAMVSMGTGLPSYAMAAGDIMLHINRYAKCFDNALVVCVSRSGRTSEILIALEALKSQGVPFKTTSLVCADDTPLAVKSDLVISTPWAFDNSVCQTRCVTNFYFAAAYIFAKITANQALLEDLKYVMDDSEYIRKAETLADELSSRPWTHCVVLADAELEGLAEEGALAFKEICQLPSNYHHLLDVRHGPFVLLNEKTLVLAALGAGNEFEYKLLQDIKEKKADTAVFSDSTYGHPLSHIARGIPFIILCQMIALKKSLKTGTNPDKPTGLEPWISL